MAGNFYGVSQYQQTSQSWNAQKSSSKSSKTTTTEQSSKASSTSSTSATSEVKSDAKVDIKEWSPVAKGSPLVPDYKSEYGISIGDVKLSDAANEYYKDLKSKFHNAEFILVSKDMKAQVQANASAYGNVNKMVVLIDEEKLERMATDESFRKKYEGIIAMSQQQLAQAKNSLSSSGATVKNFGMSVNEDGSTDFFATLEKSSADQTKRLEKQKAAKKEHKLKEKKQAEKKAKKEALEEKLEQKRHEKKLEKEAMLDKLTDKADDEMDTEFDPFAPDDKEYVQFHASTMDDLVGQVSHYAYESRNVMTEQEMSVGQNIDFMG